MGLPIAVTPVPPQTGKSPNAAGFVGLTSEEVDEAVAAGRVNRSQSRRARSIGQILRSNLLTRFNFILVALAGIIVVVGPIRDALFAFVVVANALIGVVQEWRAAHTLNQLHLLHAAKVTVWRDGSSSTVMPETLVEGDVVELHRGDEVPVDAVVLTSDQLELDASLLTGEAMPVVAAVDDEVHAGSLVVAGRGVVKARRVGDNRLASRIEAEARRFDMAQSELRATTDRLLRWITWAMLVLGPALIVRQALGPEDFRESTRSTVAGLVSMVPEGLVLLTSLTLALGAIRLGQHRVLTQELAAIELLARVDVLCMDKTGTITTGKPVLGSVAVIDDDQRASVALAALAASDPEPNLTLRAIQAGCTEISVPEGWEAVSIMPFSSQRKWGGADFGANGTWVLGAPDVLLPGAVPEPTGLDRALLLGTTVDPLRSDTTPRVTPIATVVLREEIRDSASATLAYLAREGIAVKVLSGDHAATVAATAALAGVRSTQACDASSLPSEPDDIADLAVANDVFGRVQPHGKRSLIAGLRSRGRVVAMTGDGVNDVLALKEADLGMAMGSGSPAARSVAELVLLDDDFGVVPLIVDEGRRVLANVERVSVFFLTKTAWACALAAIVAASGMPYPMYASQVTLIGFLTIGAPAFLLSFRRGAPRSVPGILDRVVRRALPPGVLISVAAATVFAITHYSLGHPTPVARTATTLVVLAAGTALVGRNLGPTPGRWRVLPILVGCSTVLAFVARPIGRLFSLEALPTHITVLALSVAIPLVALIIVVDRATVRRLTRR